jgi:hypothetical protein
MPRNFVSVLYGMSFPANAICGNRGSLNKNKCSHPVKLLSFLCSCWHTFFQYLVIHIILPSQAIFQRTQQLKTQCDGVRSGLQVWCSRNFMMAPMVYTLVCGMALLWWSSTSHIYPVDQGKHSDFFVFHYSDQSSAVIPGNESQKNNTCCILQRLPHAFEVNLP